MFPRPSLALPIGDNPASMRHPPPGRDRNGLKCRKSEIGIFSYFPAGRHSYPHYVYVPGGCRRRALDKGCISPHWCPKLRSLLTGGLGRH